MRFTVIILFIAVGCTETASPDHRLVQAYSDVVVVRELYADSGIVKQKNDSILKSYGYDSAGFSSELQNMSRTPQLLKSFFDSVSAALMQKRTKPPGS
ncbi:MAG: hypothetical protein HYX66_03705 [Ignavibacteria bacterium]|nr:hypothetical protein [Ignavibacteria bacterium]